MNYFYYISSKETWKSFTEAWCSPSVLKPPQAISQNHFHTSDHSPYWNLAASLPYSLLVVFEALKEQGLACISLGFQVVKNIFGCFLPSCIMALCSFVILGL